MSEGLIGRFGSLDPSDGGLHSARACPHVSWPKQAAGQLVANGYVINNQLTLWNDFTTFWRTPSTATRRLSARSASTVGGRRFSFTAPMRYPDCATNGCSRIYTL